MTFKLFITALVSANLNEKKSFFASYFGENMPKMLFLDRKKRVSQTSGKPCYPQL